MITDDTRKKLREHALKVGLGGDNTIQCSYTTDELDLLINKCIELDCVNTFKSLFTDTVYKTIVSWRNDVGRHLFVNDRLYFYYNIHILTVGVTNCHYCNTQLDIRSFYHSNKFRKYCPTCVENKIWKSNYTAEQLLNRGKKITQKKLEYYKSDIGKETSKSVGRQNSIKLKEYFQTEQGKQAVQLSSIRNSESMLLKIKEGTFTPNTHNRLTHVPILYDGIKFRSSWECMWYELKKPLLYESTRISYTYKGKNHVYIVDFTDNINKVLYEIKPTEHINDDKFSHKMNAAIAWATDNGFVYKIITQNELSMYKTELLNSMLPDNIKHRVKLLCNK